MQKSNFRKFMESATWICAGITVFFALLYWVTQLPWTLICAISAGTTLYHFGIRLLVGFLVPLCVRKYSLNHWYFRQRKWEAALYRKLNVRKWKRHLPTYDPSQFSREHYTLPQILHNMCQAEIVHTVIVIFSFVPLLFSVFWGEFPVFLITSVCAGSFDCTFIVARRYNRPRLMRLLTKEASRNG